MNESSKPVKQKVVVFVFESAIKVEFDCKPQAYGLRFFCCVNKLEIWKWVSKKVPLSMMGLNGIDESSIEQIRTNSCKIKKSIA